MKSPIPYSLCSACDDFIQAASIVDTACIDTEVLKALFHSFFNSIYMYVDINYLEWKKNFFICDIHLPWISSKEALKKFTFLSKSHSSEGVFTVKSKHQANAPSNLATIQIPDTFLPCALVLWERIIQFRSRQEREWTLFVIKLEN